jgi:hypothetical protein
MICKIRYKEVKVRKANSHRFEGQDKFTGAVTYSVIGSIGHHPVRLSLGTEEKNRAIRRIKKIETACAEGPNSSLWPELEESLPTKTFKFFANSVGYISKKSTFRPTWKVLCMAFELEMQRLIENKRRGASREEGVMSPNTRDRYRQTIKHFNKFIDDVLLADINKSTIELFKIDRLKRIEELKQSRGGTSIALDIAVLHRMFQFAVDKEMMVHKPIDLSKESKPGKNPKNGARPFTAEELKKLRGAADGDLFNLLVLRWTGLRGSRRQEMRSNTSNSALLPRHFCVRSAESRQWHFRSGEDTSGHCRYR